MGQARGRGSTALILPAEKLTYAIAGYFMATQKQTENQNKMKMRSFRDARPRREIPDHVNWAHEKKKRDAIEKHQAKIYDEWGDL